MPRRPPRQCATHGCSGLAERTYCEKCLVERGIVTRAERQETDAERGSATHRGYGVVWRRRRVIFLMRNPLCVDCLARGINEPATEVDHIVPRAAGGSDAEENLQGLCGTCHRRKTATGDGGLGRFGRVRA